MAIIFADCETCGFHGIMVLLQYAEGVDGEVHLWCPWKESISDTLDLLDRIIYNPDGICGFNLVFDWFHLVKLYSILILIPSERWSEPPEIEEVARLEKQAIFGPCIKPVKACDLMLWARKGKYQSTMDRESIRVKKIPTAIAYQLAEELGKRIPMKDIYFAKAGDKTVRWKVRDIEDKKGNVDPDFKHLVLDFAPSSALKALAVDALGLDEVIKFDDVKLSKNVMPVEIGYAPYATAIGQPGQWNNSWPDVIRHHITHWNYLPKAREYAKLDVVYLQKLYPIFGSPELGDDDSELACMVACVRWRGFAINRKGIQKLRDECKTRLFKEIPPEEAKGLAFLKSVPDKPGWMYFPIPRTPAKARVYIRQVMSEIECAIDTNDKLEGTTKKAVLEEMTSSPKFKLDDGTLCPSAQRAKEVLDARQSEYEQDFYDKILLAGRFHASSSVTGSLSGRMSGGGSAKGIEGGGKAKGDGLNPLGVKRTKEVRGEFPLADFDLGEELSAGDFAAYEVCLAEAVYDDPDLRAALRSRKPCRFCRGAKHAIEHECVGEKCKYCTGDKVTCKACVNKGDESLKIHALFGCFLFPDQDYYSILLSEGSKVNDYYDKSKRCFFATLYGGTEHTLNDRIAIPIEQASEGLHQFGQTYKGVARYRQKIFDMFCSMRQPGGIGSHVEWHEPAEFIESKMGFRRYFTLENQICRALFELAESPPKSWQQYKTKVIRRDRVQTTVGAVRSALYAAAFAIQAGNMRAAANHEIQSFGAIITKMVQRKVWDIQPCGITKWLVRPLNVHDEIQCPHDPSVRERVMSTVKEAVESVRSKVQLIKIDWKDKLSTWADK